MLAGIQQMESEFEADFDSGFSDQLDSLLKPDFYVFDKLAVRDSKKLSQQNQQAESD